MCILLFLVAYKPTTPTLGSFFNDPEAGGFNMWAKMFGALTSTRNLITCLGGLFRVKLSMWVEPLRGDTHKHHITRVAIPSISVPVMFPCTWLNDAACT